MCVLSQTGMYSLSNYTESTHNRSLDREQCVCVCVIDFVHVLWPFSLFFNNVEGINAWRAHFDFDLTIQRIFNMACAHFLAQLNQAM